MLDKIGLTPEIRLPYLPKEEVEVTLLSKEDVELTLPSKEEIEGKSKVFQKVGAVCGEAYWTRTLLHFYYLSYADELYVRSSGTLARDHVNFGYGVRPVLKSDNLNELIKKCKVTLENGIQIIECGNFPHMLENAKIDDTSILQKTGKVYILPARGFKKTSLVRLTEYDYNGQKVVEDKYCSYHPVKPIEWYFDKKNNMLISKGVLFNAPINIDNTNYYDGSFETSELYRYLNNGFLKQLKSFPYPNLTDNDGNRLKITPNDKAELESRIERLLRRKQELLNQSESLDNELRNGQKVKLL